MRFRRSCLWSLRYLAQDLNILLTAQRACQPDVSSETVGVGMRRGISDVRGPMVIGLVLVAVPALVLPASVSAVQPFPQIQRGHEISCSGPKAKVGVTVDWQKANRSGQHRGHAVGLIVGQNERVYSRKTASRRLDRARSQSVEYRFRFPKRASRRLCRGNAQVDIVTSHGHNRDGAGRVEIHRVARKTLGAAASASGEVRNAGVVGSDCRQGGATAVIKEGAQLQECNLIGVALLDPDLE